MKRISAAFILPVFLVSMAGAAAAAEASSSTACVYQYKGEVQILEPGAGDWITLKGPVPLREGVRLKTGPGAWCQLLAGDGSFINLYENSETVVEKLALEPESREFSFNFIKGRILWMAAKLKRKIRRFEVRTPSAVCAARGTDFTIDLASGTADIGLFDGELDITSGGKDTTLAAGSEAVAAPEGGVAVSARFSRLMAAEKRRYLKLKKRADELREKLAAREDFIDGYLTAQQKKLQDFDERRREKLEKRGK